MVDPFLTPSVVSRLREDAAKLERLAADLRRIADGTAPTAADLEAAPVIEGWTRSMLILPCLVGRVTGHPEIGSGRVTRTSDVWHSDPLGGWVRTLSRFYRLGRPAATTPETVN